jgi:hypothetical protein
MPDQILGTALAALLTIMVLSYVLGDNPFFRLATYVFVGVASGYAGAIAWHSVLWPGLFEPFARRGVSAIADVNVIITSVVPLLLVLMLVLKVSPVTARYGSLPLAILVGVGAAVVVGGAITGTLLPQSLAAMQSLDPRAVAPQTGETGAERVINVILMLIGMISTLMYFRFGAQRADGGATQRTRLMTWLSSLGRFFIALTFGVMYAGALAAAVIVLSERWQFFLTAVQSLISLVAGSA